MVQLMEQKKGYGEFLKTPNFISSSFCPSQSFKTKSCLLVMCQDIIDVSQDVPGDATLVKDINLTKTWL